MRSGISVRGSRPASGCRSSCWGNSATASAADPMFTTLAVDPAMVGEEGGLIGVARTLLSANPATASLSAFGVLLRAESAANGDTVFERANERGSGRRNSAWAAIFLIII